MVISFFLFVVKVELLNNYAIGLTTGLLMRELIPFNGRYGHILFALEVLSIATKLDFACAPTIAFLIVSAMDLNVGLVVVV